jgi:hypothetical protein
MVQFHAFDPKYELGDFTFKRNLMLHVQLPYQFQKNMISH